MALDGIIGKSSGNYNETDASGNTRMDEGSGAPGFHDRMKRHLIQESDSKVYENNIHEMMKSLPQLRGRRKTDYERAITLFSMNSHAKDRRNKVFEFFRNKITKAGSYQTQEVFIVSQELLAVLDEAAENLELLVNWCDLCLPANEQSFAESHRIKIQNFQDYLATGIQDINSATSDVNTTLEQRAQTLRSLFSTKDVLPENYEAWCCMHRDMLVHNESNSYLRMSKIWEKVLEDYLLYYNYWKTNIKNNSIVFSHDVGRGSGDYYG